MKLTLALLAVVGPTAALAQDLSQYDMFFNEQLEGVYGNRWYVMKLKNEGEYGYFSVVADGKLPYAGTFITACRTDMEDRIIPEEGSEFYELSEAVWQQFYYWVCSS